MEKNMKLLSKSEFFKYIVKKKSPEFDKNYSDAEIEEMHEKNNFSDSSYSYYLDYYDKIKSGGSILSWNWAGFFFGYCWICYRRAFLSFMGIVVVKITLFAPIEVILLPKLIEKNDPILILLQHSIGTIVVMLLFGIFGNYIYLKHINNSFRSKVRDRLNSGVSILSGILVPFFFLVNFLTIIKVVAALSNKILPYA